MILSEAEYRECGECGHMILFKERVYGCDFCERPLIPHEYEYLSCTVFYDDASGHNEKREYHFCSWRCFWSKLPKLETDWFIAFPYLQFDEQADGLTVQDFWDAVKEV